MQLQEVALCATAPSSSSAGMGAITVHDIQTGASLASFKQTGAGKHCTVFVQSTPRQGGFMLAAQPEKSILNVYDYQKDQLAMRIVLPERLSCIAVDNRGDFCAGGTSHGRIYLWEISSGIMYNAWDAHYRQVTVLRFTHDGAALVSGSDDSGVSVWSVSRLLDDGLHMENPEPFCTLSDHTLPISDIRCGVGAFPRCRVLTSSLDHSVRLWELSARAQPLLATFEFPKPIACLAWDTSERFFFAASQDLDGSLHRVNLFRQREGDSRMEALGGSGTRDVNRVGFGDDGSRTLQRKRFITVGSQITCMTTDLACSLLLVGTSAGTVQIYDIVSHQYLRSINAHRDKELSVTTIATVLKPVDLIGGMHLTLSAENKDGNAVHPKVVVPFMKMKDAKAREKKEVWMVGGECVADEESVTNWPLADSSLDESLLRDHSSFLYPDHSPSNSSLQGTTTGPTVESLQAELTTLREQLGKAKAVNDAMWERVVHKVLVSENAGSTEAEEGRQRKRGKS